MSGMRHDGPRRSGGTDVFEMGSGRTYRTGPYRSRHGVLFGVCRGLAEHFGVSVVWSRGLTLLAFLMTGIWPVGAAYLLVVPLLKPEPVLPLETEDDAEFYLSYTSSRSMALHRLKRTFSSLDRRVQRIESIVTAPNYDWERRLKEGEG